MDVRTVDDPRRYLELAGPLLLADEARHNLILGLAGTLASHPERYGAYRLWLVEDGGEPVATALRTPPYRLVLGTPRDEAALAALAAAIDDVLPGVVGTTPEIDDFTELWRARTGVRVAKRRAQGVFSLDAVAEIPRAEGRMRAADERDRPMLTAWWSAFDEEALGQTRTPEQIRLAVDHALSAEAAGIALWEHGGDVVSLAGYGGPTPNGIRVGPVFTPPRHRNRGYASSLVATLSADLLRRGNAFCFLYTDLANAVANRIYERIGYRRVAESAEVDFA